MSKVLKRLEVQEQIEGLTEDLALVKRWYAIVLNNSRSGNMFSSLVKVKFHRYGDLSYQAYTFYYASEELKALVSIN